MIKFMLLPIILFSILLNPVFGEEFTIQIDKTNYMLGETIKVSGKITDFELDVPMSVQVLGPTGNSIMLKQIYLENEFYQITIPINSGSWKSEGTHLVRGFYAIGDRVTETTFELSFPILIGDTESSINPLIVQLQVENEELKERIDSLEEQIGKLADRIDDLNQIIMEQINVIYTWILER